MKKPVLDVPPELRRGARKGDQAIYVDTGERLLEIICDRLGFGDLAGRDVLDMGCGTRITQALMQSPHPIGSYTGVDINAELVEHLRAQVEDERLSFHHMDIHNAMYNPGGQPLDSFSELPVGDRQFDVICLFSVFTHLAPPDYAAMLRLLRPYVRPEGRLLFSLFVNETTPGGHGYMDTLQRALESRPELISDKALERSRQGPPDFLDEVPGKPLLRAIYSRSHALELVEGTGWEVVSLNDPAPDIQHHMICRPL